MILNKTSVLSLLLTAILFSGNSCKSKSHEGMIIVSVTTADIGNTDNARAESLRFLPKSGIIAINPGKPGSAPEILTGKFFSAVSPEISFDAKQMLFAGQQKEGDPLQIWQMDLSNHKIKRITSTEDNCIDPAYLPGGYIVFSKYMPDDSLKSGYSLFICKLDGSDMKRITFSPNTYLASKVLSDGRILSISRRVFPEQGKLMFSVMRPNGTKADMFYKESDNELFPGPARETGDGKLVFTVIEGNSSHRTGLRSITYNRPLHSKIDLTANIEGDFISAFPLKTGKMLVSYRKAATDKYSLYEFDPEGKAIGNCIYTDPQSNVLEATLAEEHARPRKLPSEVDMHVKSGLILCQDVNYSDHTIQKNPVQEKKAVRIEILGVNASLGSVDVEKDGSFQLKPLADTPFRIITLDVNNNVINGPCDWIWLRPNERRGCIGCHEDPEQVPQNVISLAVKKKPVIIPVHAEKIKEKSVDLE
jgi:hypothetical protein